MEISFTVRRGSDDQPLTFSFLAPAVQAALRRGLQAAAQRAQQRQAGEQPTAEGGTSLTAQNVFSAVPAAAPATAAATSAAASSAASAAAPASTTGPSPASAVATAAAAAATGMAQPDLTRMVERIHRMSGAVAGSIFQDLLAGAIQPGEAGPPPASDAAIDKLVREAAPVEGQGQCSVCLADLAASDEIIKGAPAPQCIRMPCGHRFHEKCLLQWLRSHNTCPVCRFAVEASDAPRPTPLSAVLQNWHERMRAESQAGAAMAAAGAATAAAAAAAAPASQGAAEGSNQRTTRSSRSSPAASPAAAGSSAAAAPASAAGVHSGRGGRAGVHSGLTEAQLQGLSVAELKRRLAELRVDFSQVRVGVGVGVGVGRGRGRGNPNPNPHP